MEAFWGFCKELWRERRHTFGSREPRPKIDQQLHQGELVAEIYLNLGLILAFPWTFAQIEATCVGSTKPTDPHLPRRHVHQQHIRHAIQEGELWSRRRHLSSCHKVSNLPMQDSIKLCSDEYFQIRCTIRRCILEQFALLDDAVSVHDDDVVGDCVRRLVPSANVPRGEWVSHRLRQPCKERHCQAGRSRRFGVGRPVEAHETKEGVEREAARRVHETAQRRLN